MLLLTASRPIHLRAASSKARRTKPAMTDPTPLVRNAVPTDDDCHRPVSATTGAAPSLRGGGAPSSSVISFSVAGKTMLLMANHKLQAARCERGQKQAGE